MGEITAIVPFHDRAGRKIHTMDELVDAVNKRESVFLPLRQSGLLSTRLPAAIIVNMNALMVNAFIHEGLYVYKRKAKNESSKNSEKDASEKTRKENASAGVHGDSPGGAD